MIKEAPRHPLPPFIKEMAIEKVRLAEVGWNDRDPAKVAPAYHLIKELWAHDANCTAVRYACEYHDDSGNWFRAYGNENWEFDENGLMERRFASINKHPIAQA